MIFEEITIDWITQNPLFALFVIKDGKYIYVNQLCADLLELPIKSVIGTKADSIISYVADPIQREQLLSRYRVRLSTILPENRLNLRLVCPSGNEVWIELVVRNSSYKTEPVILGAFTDITERMKAEEALSNSRKRYRELVNLLPQTVFEIDSNGRLAFANKHGLEASGYTQEDLDKGIAVNQLMIPADRKRIKSNIEKSLAGMEMESAEYTILKKDGTTFPVKIYSSPIMSNNKPVGLRGVAIDITEIRERENRLKKQKNKLQLLSGQLTTIQENDRMFIARELHDIVGQGLSLIKFNLEKEMIDNPDLNNNNFQKISSMVSEVSDNIRHIISGLHPKTLEKYGLIQTINWYIEDCCNNNTICNLFTKGKVLKLPEQLELNIYRIFQEAAHNILKHAQATKIDIILEFKNKLLILKVSDNGVGFDTNNTIKNNCLQHYGIHNMRERTLMIDGTFTIESEIGKGTSVICKVPINQEDYNGQNKYRGR